MSTATRQFALALAALGVVAALLAWWVYAQTATGVLTTPPVATPTASPLTSPVIDALRTRVIYGDLPVTPLTAESRTDPFVDQ